MRRLIRDYISYYHADRIHDSLEKDTPAMRLVFSKPNQSARLVSFPRMGGLHHRYDWRQVCLTKSLRGCRTFRACTDQCLMLRWTQVSWTFQHFNFPVILRFQVHESRGNRLLATDGPRLSGIQHPQGIITTAIRSTSASGKNTASGSSRPTNTIDAARAPRTAANYAVTAAAGKSSASSLGSTISADSSAAGNITKPTFSACSSSAASLSS